MRAPSELSHFLIFDLYHPLTVHRPTCSDSYVQVSFPCFGPENDNISLRSFDSVSHTKTSLVGTSISIPITGGRLNLGTWQGGTDFLF